MEPKKEAEAEKVFRTVRRAAARRRFSRFFRALPWRWRRALQVLLEPFPRLRRRYPLSEEQAAELEALFGVRFDAFEQDAEQHRYGGHTSPEPDEPGAVDPARRK